MRSQRSPAKENASPVGEIDALAPGLSRSKLRARKKRGSAPWRPALAHHGGDLLDVELFDRAQNEHGAIGHQAALSICVFHQAAHLGANG